MLALRSVVSAGNTVFGIDFPFLSAAHPTNGLSASGVFTTEELRSVDRDNILRWLPQYAK